MAQREPLMNTYVDLASHQQQMTRQLLPVFEGVKQRYHQTFHALCEQGQVEAVKQYLKDLSSYKRQRLVKQIDDYGRLPLHLAAINGHTATVSFLLGQGANLMQLDGGGFTAWHRAAEGGEVGIFEALVKALPKRERLENHINSVTTPEGYTPLSTAAFHGHDKTVKWLINNGANVNQVISHDGSTALHAATVRGQLICVRLLLNARANGHLSNSQGETPAFLAVYYHQPHIVAELMGHGICLTQAEFEHILELGNRQMLENLSIAMQERSLCLQVTLNNLTAQATDLTAPRRLGLFSNSAHQELLPEEERVIKNAATMADSSPNP